MHEDDEGIAETETSELEKEFLAAREKAVKLINEKLAEANKALDEALNISEEYGIPFYSSISPLSQTYTPSSFYEKFSDIEDIAAKLSDWENGPGQYEGWEHSAVC